MNANMNTIKRFTTGTVLAITLVGLSGCADMTSRQKSTALGAGVGAAAGYVLSGGFVGTAVGAAAGSVVGHEVGGKR
jgi:osmotically inducible lipoprotein OsmB